MGWFRAIGFLGAMLICIGVNGQATRPAAMAQGKYESQPVMLNGAVAQSDSPTSQPASISTASQIEPWRVFAALAIVIGLIFTLRWVGNRFFPGAGVPRSSGAMKVLTRLVISPKQQLLAIQVGRRIVVVSDSSGQMSAISEIADADEVASMVAQIAQERSIPSVKGFGSLFSRAGAEFEAKNTKDVEEPAGADLPSAPDPVIADARGEIDDLADKVRLLSAQFRQ